MARKHRALVTFGFIAILTIGIFATYLLQLQQDPKVYNLTIETEDLRINDIEFVAYADSLYISDHNLEMIGEGKRFSGVSYGLSMGGDWILSLSQGDNPFTLPDAFAGKINYNTRNLIQDIKLRNHDTVHIEVMYEVNGLKKSLSGTIKAGDLIKSSASAPPNLITL